MLLNKLLKRRDVDFLLSALLTAPAFWVMGPYHTLPYLLAIIALSWIFLLFIYAFNRWTEARTRQLNQGLLVVVLGAISFVPALWPLPNALARSAAIAIMVIGVAYSIRLPGRDGWFQLRQIYLLKPIMVCGGHSLQWIVFTGDTGPLVLVLLVWHFLDLFVLTNLLDVLDARADAAEGTRTIAVVHGFKRAIEVALVANVIGIAVALAFVALSGSPWFALFLLPRAVQMQRKLGRLRRRRAAGKSVNPMLLRALGAAGVVCHYVFGPLWPPLV